MYLQATRYTASTHKALRGQSTLYPLAVRVSCVTGAHVHAGCVSVAVPASPRSLPMCALARVVCVCVLIRHEVGEIPKYGFGCVSIMVAVPWWRYLVCLSWWRCLGSGALVAVPWWQCLGSGALMAVPTGISMSRDTRPIFLIHTAHRKARRAPKSR